LIRNSTGNLGAFAANAANAFLTGTAQGDTGLTYTQRFHLGMTGKTSILRMEEAKMAVFGAAPVARAAAIASPAETLASLKVAVDQLITANKNFGITS